MVELYKFSRAIFCLVLFAAIPGLLFSQSKRTLDEHANSSIDTYIGGFYTSLPAGYNSSSATYPLLVFLHGIGEIGSGNTTDLPAVLRNGPPMQINQQVNNNTNANFPDPVVVNGNSYSFIMIAPQLNTQPDQNGGEQQMVDDVINYAISNYRVNTQKIYLTGLSMGAGIAIEYPGQNVSFGRRLAGLMVVAVGSFPAADRITAITAAHLPVWLTDNNGDTSPEPNSPLENTNGYYTGLNNAGINPPALETIFNAAGHGGWVQTYGAPGTPGVTNSQGQNVYQWMAQYSRIGNNIVVDAPGALPVTWGSCDAVLTGSSAVRVSWSTELEQNNRYFIVQRSSDGKQFSNLDTVAAAGVPHSYSYTDITPLAGSNFYRLEQVDLDGNYSYSGIMQVEISASGQMALKLKPNPAPGSIYLELANAEQGRLEVSLSDATGRVLRKWAFDKQTPQWSQSIDPGNLPAGTYFIIVKGTKTREVRSFIRSAE